MASVLGMLEERETAARFRVGEDIFATGFLIHESTWRERAER